MHVYQEQLEMQKNELMHKLQDMRTKYDESLCIRRQDKEKYRMQYESLKQKAQDKIHRLKAALVNY